MNSCEPSVMRGAGGGGGGRGDGEEWRKERSDNFILFKPFSLTYKFLRGKL